MQLKNIFRSVLLQMKKNDLILIGLVICIAMAAFAYNKITNDKAVGELYAEVYVEGNLYKKLSLEENQSITIKTKNGYNVIEIKDGRAFMSDADCPDKICLNSGEISLPGRSIVCLPHKVYVIIKGEQKDEIDAIVQ